jgi:hypothetical protein
MYILPKPASSRRVLISKRSVYGLAISGGVVQIWSANLDNGVFLGTYPDGVPKEQRSSAKVDSSEVLAART